MSPHHTQPSPSYTRSHSSPSIMSTSHLLSLSTQKLHHLSALLSSSPRDSPDLLRKGVLIQNAMDWGVGERRREKEREREGMMSLRMKPRRRSEGAVVKTMVAVVEEEEEEEDAEEASIAQVELTTSTSQSTDNGVVVDPSEYLFAHEQDLQKEEIEQDEAEAAWFEEHWQDLQEETVSSRVVPQAVKFTPPQPINAATTDVSVQIYSVDSDSDSDSDQSLHPYPQSIPMAQDISPPPSPKLSPTRLSDKLESPMEFGTMPARLESAITFEDFEAVWEVKGMDEAFILPTIQYVADMYEDVPALDTTSVAGGSDIDSDEEEEQDDEDELLITPGEEALEEFGPGSFESVGSMQEMRLIGGKGKM